MNFAFINKLLPPRSGKGSPPPFKGRRHLLFGSRGERLAARHLRRRGHRVVARNYLCPLGEIDLVTLEGGTVVFVEVKTRESDEHAELVDAVNATKWHRVERAARHYLRRYRAEDCPCRFDLVTVLWPHQGKPQIEHLQDAYQPSR